MPLNASENMVGKLLSSHLNATALRGDNGWAEIKLRTFPSPKDYSDAILRMVVTYSAGTRSTPQIIQRMDQGAKSSPPYKPDIKPNARDTEVGFQRTIQMLKWLNGTACNCKLPSFLSTYRHFTFITLFSYIVFVQWKKKTPFQPKLFVAFLRTNHFNPARFSSSHPSWCDCKWKRCKVSKKASPFPINPWQSKNGGWGSENSGTFDPRKYVADSIEMRYKEF